MSVFVNTENHGVLNLRAAPGTAASVIARIPYGTAVAAEKINETWAKVTYKGQTGYVMVKYLSTTEPAQSSSNISKDDLQRIYNSLKSTLSLIEEVLK